MDEAESDWAAEDSRDGHAALATAIASALLLLSTCGRSGHTTASGADAAAYLLGAIAACITIFWGIPYWIVIRKASRRWKIASFIVIALLATLANLWVLGSSNLRFKEGMKSQSRQAQEIARGERTRLEASSDADPLQKMMVELGNRNIGDIQAYHSALMAAGAERIAMLQGLQRNSPELNNCDRFDGFAARARANRGKLDVYLAEARPKLDREVASGTLSQVSVDEFMGGALDAKPTFERTWDLQGDYAQAVGAVCRVLARKHWVLQNGQVAFTSDSDLAAANAELTKIQGIGAEQQRMKSETIATMERNAR